MKRWKLLIATLVTTSARGTTGAGSGGLTAALAEIENQPRYQPSDWGYSVLDQNTGEVLAAQNADHLFDPGSTMKTYAVSTALRLYGSDYRFHTPVYRVGDVTGGSLDGNLILVGSGDLSLGSASSPTERSTTRTPPRSTRAMRTSAFPVRWNPRAIHWLASTSWRRWSATRASPA